MDILAAIDGAWDFSDPAASETRFADIEKQLSGAELYEVQTQRARALGLQGRFEEGHAMLDSLPDGLPPRVAVRQQLERGRLWNSAGNREMAREIFASAYSLAVAHSIAWLAIDAGHMIAIASPLEEGLQWNEKCLAQAEAAPDERSRRWRGSLLNNLGWSLMDLGRHQEALDAFERAVVIRAEAGAEAPLRIAKWCVGRALREVSRVEEALAVQQALLQEDGDGFVCEELGECLVLLDRPQEAKPYFKRAHHEFTQGALQGAVDEARLSRIASLMN